MVIGTVLKDLHYKNTVIRNVPYKKHDFPCYEGCCENELSIGLKEMSQTGWIDKVYMAEEGIKEFDFSNWNEEMEHRWKEWFKERAKHN